MPRSVYNTRSKSLALDINPSYPLKLLKGCDDSNMNQTKKCAELAYRIVKDEMDEDDSKYLNSNNNEAKVLLILLERIYNKGIVASESDLKPIDLKRIKRLQNLKNKNLVNFQKEAQILKKTLDEFYLDADLLKNELTEIILRMVNLLSLENYTSLPIKVTKDTQFNAAFQQIVHKARNKVRDSVTEAKDAIKGAVGGVFNFLKTKVNEAHQLLTLRLKNTDMIKLLEKVDGAGKEINKKTKKYYSIFRKTIDINKLPNKTEKSQITQKLNSLQNTDTASHNSFQNQVHIYILKLDDKFKDINFSLVLFEKVKGGWQIQYFDGEGYKLSLNEKTKIENVINFLKDIYQQYQTPNYDWNFENRFSKSSILQTTRFVQKELVTCLSVSIFWYLHKKISSGLSFEQLENEKFGDYTCFTTVNGLLEMFEPFTTNKRKRSRQIYES